MKLNLPVRWRDKQALSDDEDLERRALGLDDEEIIVYTLGSVTIDTNDIKSWNGSDPNHITLRTYDDDQYSIPIGHEDFDRLWTQTTGEGILEVKVKDKVKRGARSTGVR